MIYRKNIVVIILVLSAVIFGASTMPQQQAPAQQQAQSQEPFKNLKVLPKNISHAALDSIMKSFRTALGVRCNFCHVPVAGSTPPKMDYASDEKEEKREAREMITMMIGINKKYFNKKFSASAVLPINCITCHNGKDKPAKPV